MSQKHTILIVDDEPSVRDTLGALLDSKKYNLRFAEDGEQALKKAADFIPDLILLDVMMPGMNGFEVCRSLRSDQLLAKVPIIILTALDDHESRLEGIRSGADDFIAKPFDLHELRLRVQTITRLDRYRTLLRDRKEKEEFQNRLRQSERMEALGSLAAGVAHDLKNILFPILAYTEMVIDNLENGSDEIAMLEEVIIAANRAQSLIKQISNFGRQRKYEKKSLKIDSIIKETLKLIKSTVPKNITINQFIDTDSGTVTADPTGIHQIVMNLCINACHAMKSKGGELTVSLIAENKNAKLSVSDTGHGMDKKTLEKIFSPYFTTKKNNEGTGVGLAVVNRIIEDHKWLLSVDSSVGKGTVFEIIMPMVESKPVTVETGFPSLGATGS